MRSREEAKVIQQEEIAEGIFSLKLAVSFAGECIPGQFVSLFSKDQSRLLPRPISICGRDGEGIRLVYRIAGKGTAEFSHLAAGDTVDVMGPLGNGFPLSECSGKKVLLAGGGIGIPPMLFCGEGLRGLAGNAKPAETAFAVGYRSETYLLDELKETAETFVSTEDGSLGSSGNVLDAIRENSLKPDILFACGPKPMLHALKEYAAANGIACWVSMEEKMACGIGACLGCVCGTPDVDEHSHVKNKRICKDGPVFRAEEVIL